MDPQHCYKLFKLFCAIHARIHLLLELKSDLFTFTFFKDESDSDGDAEWYRYVRVFYYIFSMYSFIDNMMRGLKSGGYKEMSSVFVGQ